MEIIKPTLEKKKKKMTTKRTQEIIRRRSTMVTLAASTRDQSGDLSLVEIIEILCSDWLRSWCCYATSLMP